jgi:hypothetical protein
MGEVFVFSGFFKAMLQVYLPLLPDTITIQPPKILARVVGTFVLST